MDWEYVAELSKEVSRRRRGMTDTELKRKVTEIEIEIVDTCFEPDADLNAIIWRALVKLRALRALVDSGDSQ
jgi:hypothetical protein